jgi:hypothetical protein
MPHDRSMLEKLGLRDIPRWYREKHNIPSILPNGHGHPRPHAANGHSWKDDSALKSIQYSTRLDMNATGEPSNLEKVTKQKPATYLPTQQRQQETVLPGASQMAFRPMSSPTAQLPQAQTPTSSPAQFNAVNKKIDLLSLDHGDYMPNNNLLYRPSETSFDAHGHSHHDDLVRSLQSLTDTPGLMGADYLTSPFESTVGCGRIKNAQRSRRLYQGTQGAIPDSVQGPNTTDTLHGFHNQATASSSGASPTSKTTSSQLASPMADGARGSTTSEPATRGPSPTSLSSGPSPGVFQGRGKDKGHRKAFGAIGTKRHYRKRSVSDDDDMFFHGRK